MRIRSTLVYALLVLALHPCLAGTGHAAEFLPQGGFELGAGGFVILREPQWLATPPQGTVHLTGENVLAGRYSLALPGLKQGRYQLSTGLMRLAGGREYIAGLTLQADQRTRVKLIIKPGNSGSGLPVDQTWQLEPGLHRLEFPFTGGQGDSALDVWLTLIVVSKGDVTLDQLSVTGPEPLGGAPTMPGLRLESGNLFGVWRQGHEAAMRAFLAPEVAGVLHWESRNHREALVDSGSAVVQADADPVRIPLFTDRRGYYTCRVWLDDGRSASLSYAVVTPADKAGQTDPRFGLSLEQHYQETAIPARVDLEEVYALYRDMGVGSARYFSPAMPRLLSRDGQDYDFSQLDAALDQAEAKGIKVFVILGSNLPHLVPDWLRTDLALGNIDLVGNVRTNKLKEQAAKVNKARYLDAAAYERYLERVMSHLRGRGVDYEIWNEPGHKFSVADTLVLCALTKGVRDRIDPGARILGFSSTKGKGRGQGQDPDLIPVFYDDLLKAGAGQYIDVVSYHSGHAYAFLGDDQDIRDPETSYALRLKAGLEREGLGQKPVWDSERASPWQSRHASPDEIADEGDDELDIRQGLPALDLAETLPVIYAAGISDGVERIIWFTGKCAPPDLNAKPDSRYWLWDAEFEPTPMIVAFDVMADMLGQARFLRKQTLAGGDSARVYLFARDGDLVLLAQDWRDTGQVMTLTGVPAEARVIDGLGGDVNAAVRDGGLEMPLGRMPLYVLMPGVSEDDVEVR